MKNSIICRSARFGIFLLCLASPFFPTAAPLMAAIPRLERDVLLELYDSTDGDNWYDTTNWHGPPGSERTWFGVTVNG